MIFEVEKLDSMKTNMLKYIPTDKAENRKVKTPITMWKKKLQPQTPCGKRNRNKAVQMIQHKSDKMVAK